MNKTRSWRLWQLTIIYDMLSDSGTANDKLNLLLVGIGLMIIVNILLRDISVGKYMHIIQEFTVIL